jgi:hypothetical protein
MGDAAIIAKLENEEALQDAMLRVQTDSEKKEEVDTQEPEKIPIIFMDCRYT